MANISFNEIGNFTPNNTNNNSNQVGFFNLANDNDEAIVRFMYDTADEFELLTTHQIQLNGKYRRISCKREGMDPIDMCPLCSAGIKVAPRFYIRLIQYKMGPDGTVVAEPKVWDRGMDFAIKLKGYLDNYGPLSDMVCKVIRHGAKGSMQTTFEIVPNLSKQKYPDNVFVKDMKPFENYKALGTIVMDKSVADINAFLSTGNFPAPQPKENVNSALDDMAVFDTPLDQKAGYSAPGYQTPQYNIGAQPSFGGTAPQAPAFNPQPTATQPRQTMPWETPQAANRPVRTY